MQLLFAHDHRFLRGPAGQLYTTGCLPASAWDRYLEHFEELQVIAREDGATEEGVRLGRADRPGVSFEFFPSLSSFRQLVLPSPKLAKQMSSAVRRADAVVARLPSEIGLLAVHHARRLGKPYAVEVAGCAWDAYFNFGSLSARIYAPVASLRARRAIATAPFALYVTSSWLQGRYPTRGNSESASNVCLPPMDAAAIGRREQRLRALAEGKKPVLGTVASLQVKSKGIQTALSAVSSLRSDGFDLTYRVLGAGAVEPWRALAEALGVADLVHFDGTRSAGDGVCAWLDEIDIHLQPSFQEGLPRSTIEAMSRGAACIGSTCGGIPELLPPERLHRPGDVVGLSTRIRSLAGDPKAIFAASNADQRTAERYHPKELQRRRRNLYARLRREAEKVRANS